MQINKKAAIWTPSPAAGEGSVGHQTACRSAIRRDGFKGFSIQQIRRASRRLLLRRRQRDRAGGEQARSVLLREDEQVIKIDRSVSRVVHVTLRVRAARLPVVLREDEKVVEVDGAIAVDVAGEDEGLHGFVKEIRARRIAEDIAYCTCRQAETISAIGQTSSESEGDRSAVG